MRTLSLIVLLALIAAISSLAAEPSSENGSESKPEPTLAPLLSLIESMGSVKSQQVEQRAALEAMRKEKAPEDEIKAAEAELSKLTERYDSLLNDFEQVATGIDRETFEVKDREKFDLGKEAQYLLEPIATSSTKQHGNLVKLKGSALTCSTTSDDSRWSILV